MFTFIARSQGTHIWSGGPEQGGFSTASRRAQKHANEHGSATVLTLKHGERYRVNHYTKAEV